MSNRLPIENTPGSSIRYTIADTAANRPAAATTNAGLCFIATDTKRVYLSDGAAYHQLSGEVGTHSARPAASAENKGTWYYETDTTTAFISDGSTWVAASGGAGTVTSVALTVPAIFSVSGSPITGAGTLAISAASQNANLLYAGPTTGAAATPTFRAAVAADIPSLDTSKITTGTLAVARLPDATSAAHGIVQPDNSTITISAGVISAVGGGGSSAFSWSTKSANYTITTSDSGIAVDASGGDITITLPTAVSSTARYGIVRVDSSSHLVSIVTTGGQTVNGLSTWPLVTQYQVYSVGSTNANWLIESGYYPSPLTTAGDVLVAGSGGIPTRKGIGADSYVFTIDPSTHLPVWAANSAGFSDPTTTKGDLIVHGASTTRVGVSGTDGRVLTEDSTQATGVAWKVVPLYAPLTTGVAGPILVDNGAGACVMVRIN